MKLRDVFPEGIYSEHAFIGEAFYTVAEGNQFVHIPKEQVTEREKALLQYFLGSEEEKQTPNAWLQFFNGQADLPTHEGDLHLIVLQHSKALPEAMLSLLRELLPHLVSISALSVSQTLLVLAVGDKVHANDTVVSLLPTLESDFEVRLKLFIGNAWSGLSSSDLSTVLRLEYALFNDYRHHNQYGAITSFAQMLLRAIAKQKDITLLAQQLRALMGRLKDSDALVLALWQEQGNLAQTAQRLFIHRNSLQYRLDKYYQATGLNLKELDDLTLAYLVLLQD